jgi:flavin reductase
MRRLASGVAIVTTEYRGVRHGLAATSITSVTAEPPMLLVCVNHNASAHDPLIASARFCANLLPRGDKSVAQCFADSAGRDRRFAESRWHGLATGAPALRGALAVFDCLLDRVVRMGSHSILFGQVVACEAADGRPDPLLYLDGSFTGIAPAAP